MKERVFKSLQAALYKVQNYSGERFTKVDTNTAPFTQLPGFDSLRAVEVTVELCDLMDIDLAEDIDLFYSKAGTELKVEDIVERISQLIKASEGEKK